MRNCFCIVALLLLSLSAVASATEPLNLNLPTINHHLYTGQYSRFYMYTDRNFEGARSKPWQGGKYGYVRNPKRVTGGLVYSRFHEGLDIRPVHRSPSGEPLDTVYSIAPGKVVHANASSGLSSYGKYVVVEHSWGYGPFYSLYAHLKSVSVTKGQNLSGRDPLGKLGYTGSGLSRTRAHLHVELNMLLSDYFSKWHDKYFGSKNHHGLYNGMNLAGLDLGSLYLELRQYPDLTIPQFLASTPIYYKIAVPNKELGVLKRYPWLNPSGQKGNAWEISFSPSGLPLRVDPLEERVTAPKVTWVRKSLGTHGHHTRDRLTGSGETAKLSNGGTRYLQLLLMR